MAQIYGGRGRLARRFPARTGNCGTGYKPNATGHNGSVSAVRNPNSTIYVSGVTGASEVSLHPSSLKENPVQVWFDQIVRWNELRANNS